MKRRPLPLLLLLVLSALSIMGALAGCDLLMGRQATVVELEAITVQPQPAINVPTAPTPLPTDPPPPTEAPTEVPAETPSTVVLPPEMPEGPLGPQLLEPPDEAGGSLLDLLWVWEEPLGDEQWFELYIWPDDPDAEPEVHGWYKEPPVRVTAATLSPGRYRWKVLVVEGQGEDRGEEVASSLEEWRFTIVRPSVLGAMTEPSPVMPTRTPTPTPMPTNTPRPWWPSPTPKGTVTATMTPTRITVTPMPPTATPTVNGYPGATETPAPPEPTNTPGGYPAPTNTPVGPAPTNTPAPKVTNTPAGTAPTNTPAPKVTNTPVPPVPTTEPTAYPG
jgi:hypothetical protein